MEQPSGRQLLIINLMMLSVAMFWGVAWPVGRILATDLVDYPFSVMFLRYTFALPVLFVWMWYREGNTNPSQDDWKPLFLMAFMSVFLYQIGYMFGMQRTAASDASLVIGFNPVFVAILSVWFFSHRMTNEGIMGVCLSFTGILLIFLALFEEGLPSFQMMFLAKILFLYIPFIIWSDKLLLNKYLFEFVQQVKKNYQILKIVCD